MNAATEAALLALEAQWRREAAARAARLPPPVAVAPMRTLCQRDLDDDALERALGQLRWLSAGLGLAIGAVVEQQVEYLEAAE